MQIAESKIKFIEKNSGSASAKIKLSTGLTEKVVRTISTDKNEPEWMLEKRLKALELFNKTPMPNWGPSLEKLKLAEINYYIPPESREAKKWEDVPAEIRTTFEKLGIPEAEKNFLAGSGAQMNSGSIYHNLKKELSEKGVIFVNMDDAVHKYPHLVKKYFMTSCVPISDHKFAMLHAAVWSGGSFIYVPKGVKISQPLQAYFRMNAKSGGQFEHTLIIVDEEAELHYLEACSTPRYGKSSLHAGCVELFVMQNARMRYTSVENWSKDTFNLNTKRAIVECNGSIDWLNFNGGCLTGESQIFTTYGPKEIKTLVEGEELYVWDSSSNKLVTSKIKTKIFSGYKQVYKIEAGGREVKATANHPFLALERIKNNSTHKKAFFKTRWKPLEELKEGDLIAVSKKLPLKGTPYKLPKINTTKIIASNNQYKNFNTNSAYLYRNKLKIPNETTDDFMWLAGLIIGDGHVEHKRSSINIATHVNEDFREELSKLICTLFDYNVINFQERCIEIYSKEICNLLEEIGLTGNAGTKKIPDWIFTLPRSQILAFIAGYFDSDGHVATRAIAITSINKEMLHKIKILAISVGFGTSKIMKHGHKGKRSILGRICNTHDSWRILLNGKTIYELPSKCKRKKEKILKLNTRRNFGSAKGLNFISKTNEEIGYSTITKINALEIEPTYDIEVEKHSNFIVNGLIVHNSQITMLYPCSVLKGEGAKSESLGVAFASKGQNQDTGSKSIHLAPNTTSVIRSKSISKDGGVTSYRGSVVISKNAINSKVAVSCDALLLDAKSKSNTHPYMRIDNNKVDISHEASVGKISEEQIYYLQSRGVSEEEAVKMIVNGFVEPVTRKLPLEYAVEFNRLIELEMEDSIG